MGWSSLNGSFKIAKIYVFVKNNIPPSNASPIYTNEYIKINKNVDDIVDYRGSSKSRTSFIQVITFSQCTSIDRTNNLLGGIREAMFKK